MCDRVGIVSFRRDFDAVVIDVDKQSREERSEKITASQVGRTLVQAAGLTEQLDVGQRLLAAVAEPFGRELELFGHGGLLERGPFELVSQLRDSHGAVYGELDEAFFLCVEFLELPSQLRLRLPVGFEELADRLGDPLAHAVNRVGAEALGLDCAADRRLHLFDADGRSRAESALLCGADEVLVSPAVAGRLAEEKPAPSTGVPALSAEDDALQVVEVNDVAVALPLALVEDLLHLEENLL